VGRRKKKDIKCPLKELKKKFRELPESHKDAFSEYVNLNGDGVYKFRKATTGDSDSWGTPKNVIDLAKQVLGTIELDPASNGEAQSRIKAKRHFTKKDDALKPEWKASTVYLNPPYSEATKWMTKALEEYSSGRTKELIILIHDDTKTKWWHSAFGKCAAICMTQGVLKFHHPNEGKVSSAPMGSHIFYFGKHSEKFVRVFASIGTAVSNTWATQKAKLTLVA
jgi:phage N-6-adenine-methyltransferase